MRRNRLLHSAYATQHRRVSALVMRADLRERIAGASGDVECQLPREDVPRFAPTGVDLLDGNLAEICAGSSDVLQPRVDAREGGAQGSHIWSSSMVLRVLRALTTGRTCCAARTRALPASSSSNRAFQVC